MLCKLPEPLSDRWANLHALVRFLILTAAAALVAWLVMKPVYQAFKAWRVARNLVAARQAVAEERMDDARDFSLTVLRAGDPCVEAYRILEKATAALRDPNHGEISRALLAHVQSSDADRLKCFRSLATDVATGLLGQTWTTLPAECQLDPRFATAFADRLLAEHLLKEASSVLLAVPAAARNSAVELRLIRILIDSGKGEGYGEAQQLIAAKMPAAGEDLDEWLDLLEEIPPLRLRADLLDPVRKVLQHPPDGSEGRMALMLARINYAADFSRCAAILEAAISNWQDRDPKSLADFLAKLGLYQRLQDTFPTACLETHPELFPRLLEASEKTGAWEHAVSLLDKHGKWLPKFEELAHRALAAAGTHDHAAHFAAWSAAMADAKACPLPTALLTLHRIASDGGLADEAEQALVAAIRYGRGPLPLYAQLKPLLNSLVRQGRDWSLLETCASYLAFEPGNPVLLTQFVYLACLNDVSDPKSLLKAMELLAAGYPKELPIQCVLATAYLCNGQPDKAAATFDRLELDSAQLAPGSRAAFLTTQLLAHRITKDDPRIADFPWKSLQPCERKKFGRLVSAEP